ncbi:DUF3892 domain-containing protein [Burkholderia pseudomallei]|uniref:DUF3892 domain-containing protein n=2 Tax=Burkholderia pseudomallei TaxID=28450 RepID=UPI00097574D6|nr:DUF3892 domain-containing protein [Burkholderia pseudomallei]
MATTIKCIGRRMAGGYGHEHIAFLWWVQVNADGLETGLNGCSSRADMVAFIETNGIYSVWCPDRNPNLPGAWVHVHSNGYTKYVQTVADGRKSDNLLALPER